jgi:hypothetical protein
MDGVRSLRPVWTAGAVLLLIASMAIWPEQAPAVVAALAVLAIWASAQAAAPRPVPVRAAPRPSYVVGRPVPGRQCAPDTPGRPRPRAPGQRAWRSS